MGFCNSALGLLALLALALGGCKAQPGILTPFLGQPAGEGMVEVPEVKAFHRAWCKPDVAWEKYKSIYVAPVNTDYLREMSWWEGTNLSGQDEEGMRALAGFTRETFMEAHRNNTHDYRLEVVETPRDDSVILELALTEVVPTKAWLNTVAFAGLMMAVDKGIVSMEGRLRDGETEEIIAKFADREQGRSSLVGNVKDVTWYGHAKAIVREWGQQSVVITNAEADEVIKDSSAFELKMW